MATIEKYCAPGVYDTPSYSQAIKVRTRRRFCSSLARCLSLIHI